MRAKRLVGIVAGTGADDHELSLKDGIKVCQHIDSLGKFATCLVEVGQPEWKLHQGTDVVTFDKNKCEGVVNEMRVKPDVFLILSRGKVRESGELQEYFDKMGVPFSNSGTEQTRLTFNKHKCINALREAGLPVIRSILLDLEKGITDDVTERIEKKVGIPCFVKPNKNCGSCGITKVHQSGDLKAAVELAQTYDDEVVVESAVTEGVEVCCTIHDITTDDLLEAFPVTEITPNGEYFHTSNVPDASISTPAKTLRGEVAAEIVKVAKIAYRTLKLTGLASFDMILQDDLPVVLEVNSVPSLGPDSLIERQVNAGLSIQWQRSLPKFYSILVEHAIKTYPLIKDKNMKRK